MNGMTNFNAETAKILGQLLELQEDIIATLEQDIKESGVNPHSFLFNADKYAKLIKKYYIITNLLER
jgi:hypothetical protein